MKFFFLFSFVLLGAGCALLDPYRDQAAEKTAELVDKYCEQTDENFRAEFRAAVNENTRHSIVITCAE